MILLKRAVWKQFRLCVDELLVLGNLAELFRFYKIKLCIQIRRMKIIITKKKSSKLRR